jgi:hypothetical protein
MANCYNLSRSGNFCFKDFRYTEFGFKKMSERINNLIKAMAREEEALLRTELLAPCVRGGELRARVNNLIYTFKPLPEDFEGWGIFLPMNNAEAELLEEAGLFQIAEYLQLLKPLRVRLAFQLWGASWLAYPANESDAMQKTGAVAPTIVHLVTEGAKFEQIIARTDGSTYFFEEVDRRADPQVARTLLEAFNENRRIEDLKFENLTPEMRVAYELALSPRLPQKRRRKALGQTAVEPLSDDARLAEALRLGGGVLENFTDRGEFWTVEWTAPSGDRHTSAISKTDLTVISSGICLSGRDRDFDLQSLVGVIDGEWD